MQRKCYFLLLTATFLLSVVFFNNTFGRQKSKQTFTPTCDADTTLPGTYGIIGQDYNDDNVQHHARFTYLFYAGDPKAPDSTWALVDSQIMRNGDQFVLQHTPAGDSRHHFAGWVIKNANGNLTTDTVKDGQTVIIPATQTTDSTIKVYAQFLRLHSLQLYTDSTQKTIYRTFVANNGEIIALPQSSDEDFDLPIHDGYGFIGWKPAGASDDDTVHKVKINGEDVPLVPVVATSHTVKFNINSEGEHIPDLDIPMQHVFVGKKVIAPTDFTEGEIYFGYQFDGWYEKNADYIYTTKWDFNNIVTQDVILYAKWTPTLVPFTVEIWREKDDGSEEYKGDFTSTNEDAQQYDFIGYPGTSINDYLARIEQYVLDKRITTRKDNPYSERFHFSRTGLTDGENDPYAIQVFQNNNLVAQYDKLTGSWFIGENDAIILGDDKTVVRVFENRDTYFVHFLFNEGNNPKGPYYNSKSGYLQTTNAFKQYLPEGVKQDSTLEGQVYVIRYKENMYRTVYLNEVNPANSGNDHTILQKLMAGTWEFKDENSFRDETGQARFDGTNQVYNLYPHPGMQDGDSAVCYIKYTPITNAYPFVFNYYKPDETLNEHLSSRTIRSYSQTSHTHTFQLGKIENGHRLEEIFDGVNTYHYSTYNGTSFTFQKDGGTILDMVLTYRAAPFSITFVPNDGNGSWQAENTAWINVVSNSHDFFKDDDYSYVETQGNGASYAIGGTKNLNHVLKRFDGWYNNANFEGEPHDFSGKRMPGKDLIFFGKWTPVECTVVFHPNNSSDNTEMQVIVGDSNKVLRIPNPERGEDIFGGWYTDEGFTNLYDFNTNLSESVVNSMAVNDSIHLYAKWTSPTPYTIFYDATSNGNLSDSLNAILDAGNDPLKYFENSRAEVKGVARKAGEIFIGWRIGNSDIVLTGDDLLEVIKTHDIADGTDDHIITLVAQYAKIQHTSALTYHSNYPNSTSNTELTVNNLTINGNYTIQHDSASLNLSPQGKYLFVGWTNTPGEKIFTNSDEREYFYKGEKVATGAGNNHLYAVWEKLTDLSITKIWEDNNDNDGYRPAGSFTLTLTGRANGNIVYGPTSHTFDNTTGNTLTHTFENLYVFHYGDSIEYAVTENEFENFGQYTANTDGLTITNTHQPDSFLVKVYKHWDDGNNIHNLRAPVTMQLYQTTAYDITFDPESDNEGWTAVGEPKAIESTDDYASVSWKVQKNLNSTAIRYAVKEVSAPTGYKTFYANGGMLTAANLFADTITNTYRAPVEVTLLVNKQLSGRTWFPTDTFAMALIPKIDNIPMPGGSGIFSGIPFARIELKSTDEQGATNDIRKGSFLPITYTFDDLGNANQKTFTYVIRELNPAESGLPRIPGINYSTSRFEADITITKGNGGTLEVSSVKYYPISVENEIVERGAEIAADTFVNSYNVDTRKYAFKGAKSLIYYGAPSLQDHEFSFTLIPFGKHADIAPMPEGTVTVNGTRTFIANNTADRVINFFNGENGLLFDYDGLIQAGFTDSALIAGIYFEYQVQEVIPENAVNLGNGFKYLRADGMTHYYDAVVHYRTIMVQLDTTGGIDLLNVYDNVEPLHQDLYIAANNIDTIRMSATSEEHVLRHGVGTSPLFLNARITDTTVTVRKLWVDGNNGDNTRPQSVTVRLLANGIATDSVAVLSESNGWKHTFTALPAAILKTNFTLDTLVYSVTEEAVTGYTTAYSGNMKDGFTVTNTVKQADTLITITKAWADNYNQDGFRPVSVTLTLTGTNLANDTLVRKDTTLTATVNWTATLTLPKYDLTDGTLLTYTLNEEVTPEYYTKSIEQFTVTNSHTPDSIEILAQKIWDDFNNQDGIRPASVKVTLLADGDSVNVCTLSEANHWKASFGKLPRRHNAGQAYVYTLRDAVEGYNMATGELKSDTALLTNNILSITNTHTPDSIMISAKKVWDDNNDQDGKRPMDIFVTLLANGTPVQMETVSHFDSWEVSFGKVPRMMAGNPIEYTVTDEVDEYELTAADLLNTENVTANSVHQLTLTNTHTPDSITFIAKKLWIDNNNNDGIRPASVDVQLIAFDPYSIKAEATLSEENSWQSVLGKWPMYADGELITYILYEDEVAGYNSSVEYPFSADETVCTTLVTNKHLPDSVYLTVRKHWEDGNNRDDLRAAIQVALYQTTDATLPFSPESNNEGWTMVGAPVTLDTTDYASHSWRMPKYFNQQEIRYAVKEESSLAGYVTTYEHGGLLTRDHDNVEIITNTHKSPVDVTLEVAKMITNRAWFETDTFVMALLAHPKTNPLPVISGNNNGTPFSEVRITSTESVINDSVRLELFSHITYTMEDLEGKTDTVFLYTIREMSPAETDLEPIPGITYSAKRFDVEIHIFRDDHDSLQAAVTYWAITTSGGEEVRDEIVQYPVLVNRYDETSSLYHPLASKSLAFTGDHGLNTLDFQFEMRPAGQYAAIAPMPMNTVGTGTDRVLTVSNTGSSVRFFENNADGLLFSYVNLHEHFTDAQLYEGVNFSYQMKEVIPDDAVNHNDGTMSKKVGNVENVYDAVVHYCQVNVKIEDAPGEVILLVVTPIENTVLNEFYVKDNGDTVVLERGTLASELRHSGNAPVFRNARIVDTTVKVNKNWVDYNDALGLRPETVTVTLLKNGVPTDSTAVLSEGNHWQYTFCNLPTAEIDDSFGLNPITYSVQEEYVANYAATYSGNEHNVWTITNTLNPNLVKKDTSITVKKSWVAPEGTVHPDITIVLLRDSEMIDSVELTSGDLSHTFSNLPYYDVYHNGNVVVDNSELHAFNYTVLERPVDGYASEQEGSHFTNTFLQEYIDIPVMKVWNDHSNLDGSRPLNVILRLTGSDGSARQVALSSSVYNGDTWEYTFTHLPKYTFEGAVGTPIVYTLSEPTTPTFYEQSVNGYTVTNTSMQEYIDIPVTKIWEDDRNNDGFRPDSVTLTLTGTTSTNTVTFTRKLGGVVLAIDWDDDQWDTVFTGLPKYDANLEAYQYTLSEDAVQFYTTEITGNFEDGFTITNTHADSMITFIIRKEWVDNGNQDGIRPNVAYGVVSSQWDGFFFALFEDNGYTVTANPIRKYYKRNPNTITVNEAPVPDGYDVSYSGSVESGEVVIINTHKPDSVLIMVDKIWDDHFNNDGIRPTEIHVNLLANGDSVDTRTITGTGHEWEANFGKWPVKSNGDSIEYSLSETWVPGYQSPSVVILDTETEGVYKLRITNKHELDSIDLHVVKVWNDFGHIDSRNDVTLQLYRNNESDTLFDPVHIPTTGNAHWVPVGNPMTIGTEKDTIAVTWSRMPQFYKGDTIRYAVKELQCPDYYTTSYIFGGELTADNKYTDTIINTHIEATVSSILPVRKKLVGREWLTSDIFEMALIPERSTQPMPATVDTIDGIVYSPLFISQNSTFVNDSVREGIFAPITFSTTDMAGATTKTFLYHIRELTAAESGMESIIGLTYGAERYEVDITVEFANNSLEVTDVAIYPIHHNIVDNEISEYRGDRLTTAPMITNRYNDSVTIYHMVADKQLTVIGLADTLHNNDYHFMLKPVGENAPKAPMPANTVNDNGYRYLVVSNEGNAVRFFDDDLEGDGLRFDYQQLINAGFTDVQLIQGIEFEYEMHEIIPTGATYIGNGFWSRTVTNSQGIMVDEIFDGIVHFRKISVRMEEIDNKVMLHVTSSVDDHQNDFFVSNTGDTTFLSADSPAFTLHHGYGSVPIFRNSRIARVNIAVEKAWDDFNNALSTRPEQITVHLLANNTDTVQTATLTAGSHWTHTFQNLPAATPTSGLINYSIVEESVPHYESSYLGDMVDGFTILNTLVSYGEDSDCTISVDRDQLSECPEIDCSPVTDDGITYNVVKIDGYCWMAENLRKQTTNAMVYQSALSPNTEENLATYGYLYTWHDAAGGTDTPERIDGYVRGICPNGWHLPTEAEINVLMTNTMFALSSDSLWVNSIGTNSTGFNALPAGYYNATSQRFEGLHAETFFMGDTQSTAFHFEYYCCKISNNVNLHNNNASIRCVKDCE